MEWFETSSVETAEETAANAEKEKEQLALEEAVIDAAAVTAAKQVIFDSAEVEKNQAFDDFESEKTNHTDEDKKNTAEAKLNSAKGDEETAKNTVKTAQDDGAEQDEIDLKNVEYEDAKTATIAA